MLKFARYLPNYGWLPTVLTVDPEFAAFPSTDETLLQEIPPEVKIIRTRAWDPFRLYGRFQGKKKADAVEVGHVGGKLGFKRVARWLRGNVFLPDARIGWVPFASRVVRKLVQEQKFDAIMSTGPPHSSHLVGMAAYKASKLPWVVDMRDPWVEIYYRDQMYEGRIANKIQSTLERRVLSTASAVVSVSKHVGLGLKRRVQMQHYETIPNGFDPADILQNQATRTRKEGAFTVAYIGTYTLRRHSNALVVALQKLQATIPVEVHFVGKVDSEALERYRVNGIPIEELGYLPHNEAVAYMQEVDIFLLPLPRVQGHNGAGDVSGKVFEYMSARRPILALGPTEGDLADILNQVHAGNIFDYEDQVGMFDFLKSCLESRKDAWPINDEALAEYERPRLTGRLAHLLDQLSKSDS
ncbi:MAG: glycosyltransferase family 4 protein [Rhodothermaceae bacterium]|nr:glycosyltransferase family 4 protein [Rhodothermaceae bacterium]MYG68688.1 glycosyltransferase family 4 protein [Rhodothermaceae bacterium]MYJ44370.1 glycosyltransferase family 4 protein [Rhodothermaceae bacterium]